MFPAFEQKKVFWNLSIQPPNLIFLTTNYVSWWYDNVNDFAMEFMNHQDMIWREEIKHLIQLIILIKLEIHDLHS